ncbi:MAG: histidine kinase [Bdellovibrionales bacterium]|nr:histidine kinase [Bdellovibrionales bacterium]
MSQRLWNDLGPFLSVFIVVITLFSLVFLKMEVRRHSYSLWKATREYQDLQNQNRLAKMELAQVMRPDRLRTLALNRLTLSEAKRGQVIQLDGEQIAIPQ